MCKRKLRVANIIEEGKLGGPQLRILAIAKELRHEVETTVIMPRENSDSFRQKCEIANIPYKVFSISRITKELPVAFRYVFFSIFEVLLISKYIKRNKFDLVHVSGGSWQFKGVIAGRLAGVKVLWHLNDTCMPTIIKKIFKLFSPLASGIICSSYRTLDYYAPYFDNSLPLMVIYPPVNVSYFDPAVFISDVHPSRSRIIVGTLCNINPTKNIELIINVASCFKSREEITFQIAGPVHKNQESYFLRLCNLIKKSKLTNIEFIGNVSDVRGYLSQLDIYFCSSLHESGPMSLFEAMSMGKPIITTNVGDVSRYMLNDKNGYIIESVSDVKGAMKYISKLSSNAELRSKLGSQSRELARNYFDVEKSSTNHKNIYFQICRDYL